MFVSHKESTAGTSSSHM